MSGASITKTMLSRKSRPGSRVNSFSSFREEV
jgi:hypothetical protein